ncbi:MAG: glycine--tRNA ligase subunit beta [Candidatus Thiodiazotropha taylori]|nr:glycine--tRNA ligase subunit beta [Candidatus Thiodiazotropha taylori]MCG8106450.1 glycine--tRNA ligase subunit beta [Candidatus Thiodiazotropha taylori]MCG8112643.1 glycine--tRNA ligase subunit beta [Candidatus Thiodiazotropha taylori]MCW4278787.1 glycine--tRNA ligase subunit beta [Candidatus Thiodiazotropha taylori]MCW4285001.1 glycine--tRNA ligase subunit beta [Candidatus Thiodiazotropha taylori]
MADQADLLFELGTEELPPKALKRLSHSLTETFIAGLKQANLNHAEVVPFATPRRLALLVRDCDVRQPDSEMERRGPAVQAAFDDSGNPTKAAEGFARSCQTTVDQLQRQKTDKGEWLSYRVQSKGKPAEELLPEIATQALNKLPIPKRMRWGDSDAQFVRPVHWLLFLLGDQVVPCTLLDAEADRLTYGHRFHHPSAITIYNPQDYASVLEDLGYVIADFEKRKQKISESIQQSATELGGEADLDSDLLDEVTALNEWPLPISASFEERFLAVPQEALVATMKGHQKYFPLFTADGQLMNHFITIANIDSPQPELIREGNERVIRPRLADAMFFWEQDGKKPLGDHQESLKHVVFQNQLGSMYDKSQRVADLAKRIAADCDGDRELAYRAGLLSRCDLMTNMVYEFPEMQGIMGRYQAQRDGEPEELAQALDEFYMPRFSGDQLPQTKTGIAVSLAEKLDTLVGIFGIGQKPTGDKDPFALRRAALGALRIIREHSLTLDLPALLESIVGSLGDKLTEEKVADSVYKFMLERLKGIYSELGISVDLFQSVADVAPKTLADFDQRVWAIEAFSKLPEAESLSAANKRIRNILKKSSDPLADKADPALYEDQAEHQLAQKMDELAPLAQPLFEQGEYAKGLQILAGLREPVDSFFDQVMVMTDDQKIRTNRLSLLAQLERLFLSVADITRLQVQENQS